MAGLGGFYKGEKKKKKKDSKNLSSLMSTGIGAPTFEMPKLIEKKRKNF